MEQQTTNTKHQTMVLEVYNMLGAKMHKAPVSGSQGSATFPAANWPSGLYNIGLRENGTTVASTRLVVGR